MTSRKRYSFADRVVIMSARPATIQTEVLVDLPRPRDLDSPGYLRVRDEIFRSGYESEGRQMKIVTA
jgi:NitT/TauT family transport system ATP-binding protein